MSGGPKGAKRAFWDVRSMEEHAPFSAKQLDIGSLDELVRLDAKPTHEFLRFAHTCL